MIINGDLMKMVVVLAFMFCELVFNMDYGVSSDAYFSSYYSGFST
jgi:hypothetical protein